MTVAVSATSFMVNVSAWTKLSSTVDSDKVAVFGKNHNERPLDDAKFELFYAKHGTIVDGVMVSATTMAADIVKVVAGLRTTKMQARFLLLTR